MDENNLYQGQQQEPLQPIKKKKSPLLFIIPVVIVAFLVVFFVVPPVLSNSLASKGDYKKAISIVKLNPVYKSKARELKVTVHGQACN
jgi:flagellar basal body-associated protein FliL